MLVHGEASDEVDERGRPTRGCTLLLLLNAGSRSCSFALPKLPEPGLWREVLSTARPGARDVRKDAWLLPSHSLSLLDHGATP
jgi:glycogen operon protein